MIANAIDRECQLEESKLFGEVFLPDEWLEKDIFSIDEFFLCQLDLNIFKCDNLPKCGYLYFFIETRNFKKNKMKAVVRYFNGEPDASTEFNDGLFENEEEFALEKSNDGDVVIGELNPNDNSKITLLSLSSDYLPFDCDFEFLSFEIALTDLKSKNFQACELKFC